MRLIIWIYEKLDYIGHELCGLLIVPAFIVHPMLVLGWEISFLSYQIAEDWRIYDSSYHDIRAFNRGQAVGILILFSLKLLKLL